MSDGVLMKQLLATILILTLGLSLNGCSTLMSAGGEKPVSEDYGRRTFGTWWDDQMVESRGAVNIKRSHEKLKDAHINVTAFNGVVLITGQVPSEELRGLSADQLKNLRKVRKVHNELEIAGPTSMVARTNDSWLTTKVKTKLGISNEAEGGRIKVITENGVVYLMGLLTRNEADAVVQLAQSVYGVQKIVKVFEYIDS